MGSTVNLFRGAGTDSLGSATATATNGAWTITVTLTDGANTLTATATDRAGNTSDATDAVIITLDTGKPAKPAITTTAQSVNTASFTLTGTAEVGSTVNLLREAGTESLGSATATKGSWTITVTLTDGANTLTATATDRAGNTSDATDAVIITLDTGKPAKPAITTTAQSVNTASFTLTGTAEVGSTVNLLREAGTESLGSATATKGSWTITVTLTDGANTLTATATDRAGNTSDATDAVIITLDTGKPAKPAITTTAQSVNTASFTLTGTAEVGSTVNLLREAGTESLGSATATKGSWTITVTLTDGANTLTATATDRAGNTSDATDAVIITLDTGKPAKPAITTTAQSVNTASFTLTGTAEVGSTVNLLREAGTESLGSATATKGSWTITVTLTDGANTLTATATDRAGNTSDATDAVIITLDTGKPAKPAITTTAQSVNTASFTLTGTAEVGSTVNLLREAGTESLGSATATNGAWTITVTLTDGANTLTATATDRAGNTSDATDAVIITLDTGKPAKPAITTTAQSVNTASFTLTGTAEVGSTVNLLREAGTESLGSATATNGAWTITVTLRDGANTITATATDRAGNTSDATDAVIITLDTGKPAKPAITTTAQSVNTASFTLTGTAEVGSTVNLLRGAGTESLGSATATATNGAWTITVTLTDGANTLTATATDRAGNTSDATDAVIITLDTGKPAKPAITTTAQSVNTASFTLTGTAEVGSTVNLFRGAGTDSLGSATATATNGAWTITVTLTDGANTLTATATDRAGNTSDATDAVIITLDTGKPAKPAITTTAQSVNTASFTLTGTAEVGSTVNLFRGAGTDSLGSATATATNGAWTITVTLTDGANTLTATATDRAGNTSDATDAVIITLDTGKPAKPAITTTAQSVNTASFTLTGTAEVGSTVNLFRGAGTDSLGSATATATNGAWTITVTLDDGANTLTATATDRAGNTSDATDAVIITRDTGKPAKPAITTTAQSVNTASFTLTGTAEVGSTVNLFRGAGTDSLGSATATATKGSWTITVTLTDGANTLTATATDRAGNTSDATDAVIITLDTGKPAKPAITTTAQSVNTASFTLTGTAEVGSTVNLLRDGLSWQCNRRFLDSWQRNRRATRPKVTITLDTVKPEVAITLPTKTLTNTDSFTLTGDAETGSTVNLLRGAGTDSLGSATATKGAWTITVTLTEGANTITATATDAAGNVSTPSASVTITLDTGKPAKPAITTTAQLTNTASFTLTGDAETGSTVELLRGTDSLGTATATKGSWTITVTLTEGANTITATATDVAGNVSTPSASVTITLDTGKPEVAITRPTNTLTNTASFTLTGDAETGSTVNLLKGTESLGTATATKGSWTITVTLTEGANTITATATDAAGNVSTPSASVTITLDTGKPAKPAITTTAQSVNTASFTLTGTAEVGSTVNLLREAGTDSLGTATATKGSWTITVTLTEGANTITATATDAAGNVSTPSVSVTITLDTGKPEVAITRPTNTLTNTASFTLTGDAETGSTVNLLKGTDSLGTATATKGSWTITVTLTEGANTITATATDAAGNVSTPSASVTITLDTGKPEKPVITRPTNTLTNTASFTLTGDAETGSTQWSY